MTAKKLSKIEQLRLFFDLAVGADDLMNVIQRAVSNHPPTLSEQYILLSLGRNEMNRDNPDLQLVDRILARLEELAINNKANDNRTRTTETEKKS